MRILGVGIAALDVICDVACYPKEDEEVRAQEFRIVRGGNVTNTLVALSGLGHQCYWAGTLSDESDSRYILDDLAAHKVDTTYVKQLKGGRVPTSYVVSSSNSGSRTIVHYRDLPEYDAEAFAAVDLSTFDWIHFEGRNIFELEQMLKRVAEEDGPPCSLEVEKPRSEIERLFELPDVLIFSKNYATSQGHDSAEALLKSINRMGQQRHFCAWGEHGGCAVDENGFFHASPAYSPAQVIDTLGAGDVFNAGVIHALENNSVDKALQMACRLAGKKCGQQGFGGLSL